MINREDLSDNDKECLKIFNGLPPFTITVTEPEDALFLAEGLLLKTGCPPELIGKTLETMAESVKYFGDIEKGLSLFFETGAERGFHFPAFMKPIFIHLFNHILNKEKE